MAPIAPIGNGANGGRYWRSPLAAPFKWQCCGQDRYLKATPPMATIGHHLRQWWLGLCINFGR
jgi:hypothetical protein